MEEAGLGGPGVGEDGVRRERVSDHVCVALDQFPPRSAPAPQQHYPQPVVAGEDLALGLILVALLGDELVCCPCDGWLLLGGGGERLEVHDLRAVSVVRAG